VSGRGGCARRQDSGEAPGGTHCNTLDAPTDETGSMTIFAKATGKSKLGSAGSLRGGRCDHAEQVRFGPSDSAIRKIQ